MNVVSGEDLLGADLATARVTGVANAAGDDRRYHHPAPDPAVSPVTSLNDGTADLMAEGEGKGLAGGYAVVEEAEIGVADATASHLDQDLARLRLLGSEFPDHGLAGGANGPRIELHGRASELRG